MSRVIKRFANIEFIVILQLSHKRKVEGHISTQMRVACVYVCVCLDNSEKVVHEHILQFQAETLLLKRYKNKHLSKDLGK